MPTQMTRRRMLQTLSFGVAGTALLGTSACSSEGIASGGTRLRMSHQWPKSSGKGGDFRSMLAQKFADRVSERTDGNVQVRVSPNGSLVEADAQYKAIEQGTIDMSVFPVVYAVGQYPAFDVTTLPCLIRNHRQAQNWKEAEIGRRLESIFEKAGSKILVWNWNSLCQGVKQGSPIVRPDDVRGGAVWRGAGPRLEQLLQKAGASITSMSSSEIYSALQTGVLDGFATSPGSYRSYRLYEQTSSYTSPTQNTLGFFFEPLLIGLKQFEELPDDVQTAFEETGASLQSFAYEASEKDDLITERKTKEEGVTVTTIDDAAFAAWKAMSEPIWSDFAAAVPGGEELVELAKQVPVD
jgi:TRAP-type C4-dicarboxylate transport system substrate-binding protein